MKPNDFGEVMYGLNRLRENSKREPKSKEGMPQGLKPTFIKSDLRPDQGRALTHFYRYNEFLQPVKPVPFKLKPAP